MTSIPFKYPLPEHSLPEHSLPKHLPANERRAATVKTVIDLAAEQNPSEITTTVIAQRMGLTQGALFRHFPKKTDIFQAVICWVADTLLARIDAAAAGVESPLVALEAIFMVHVGFVAKHPGVPRILFGELQQAGETLPKQRVQSLMQQYGKRLTVLLEAGKAQGELAPDLDVGAAKALFLGSIQGLVVQSMMGNRVASIGEDAPDAFAIYRRGIRNAL